MSKMTNVGREKIDYQEYTSSIFVKGGGLLDSDTILFYLTDRRNKRTELLPRSVPPIGPLTNPFEAPPKGLSKAEMEKWFDETNAMGQAHATFSVKLLPGETLHSLGDDGSPVENFKALAAEPDFDTPGTYARLAAVRELSGDKVLAAYVVPRSGTELTVRLPGDGTRVERAYLIGDARFVFEGVLDPEATVTGA